MEKNSYFGIWVDKEILKIVKNGNERLLLGMIVSLSKNAPCIASNDYFARELCLSGGQVSKLISHLQKEGIIKRFVDKENGNKRKITIDKKYHSLYSNESRPIDKNEDRLYSKTSTNNIVDNININTSTTTEKLRSNFILIDNLCEEYKLKKEFVLNFIDEFVKRNEEDQKVWIDNTDLFKHFKSSLIIKLKREEIKFKLDKEVNWFIERFNDISKRDFRVTPTIKKLFAKQFEVGYKGSEMCIAVENMYSSSVENKFHIDSSFKYATPQYLLKDDNINKYLNVRWSKNKTKKAVRIG